MLALSAAAHAQFSAAPTPLAAPEPPVSGAEDLATYRMDLARHLYLSYPLKVHRGKLAPLLFAVAVVETTIDSEGKVLDVSFTREPAAAKEVMPWIVAMIQRAQPHPAPTKLGTAVTREVWLVDKSGRFQLDSLTEGQASAGSP